MSWARFDDGFPVHGKVKPLSVHAKWLQVTAVCYCARNITDGVLDAHAVRIVRAEAPASPKHVAELVTAGLWLKRDDGGFELNNYLEYNPSASHVKDARKRNAERQAAHRAARNSARNKPRNAVTPPVSNAAPIPNPLVDVTLRAVSLRDGESAETGFDFEHLLKAMPA